MGIEIRIVSMLETQMFQYIVNSCYYFGVRALVNLYKGEISGTINGRTFMSGDIPYEACKMSGLNPFTCKLEIS